MEIVVATRNKGKIKEILSFGIPSIIFTSLEKYPEIGEIEETGSTFTDNALLKARHVCNSTGLPALADDSGLVVDALNGEPGVYSARFGNLKTDKERYMLLLQKMHTVPDDRRQARFVCVMALVFPDGREYIEEGVCEGVIAKEPAGENGFGYDPVFYIPELGKTMAQLPLDVKNAISHRARALQKVKILLEKIVGEKTI
ncbi:MAG TPA: XTP/dITP diphosphatase [Spirochaetota bacterium]|nr:XTP/dITP diphosphatase [Spirochaetota bacterium]HOM08716.1 XTP/dITP diphosphatase [Spirochaetota bacterium]HPP48494.1 XTP/dITP diphosphatase [Spirochaetota bacterium]